MTTRTQWVRNVADSHLNRSTHVNFMSGDEQDRVSEAYRNRWGRLVAVKTHYDPNNFFRLNQNVRPLKMPAAQRNELKRLRGGNVITAQCACLPVGGSID
jgi:Berberine and berberine like